MKFLSAQVTFQEVPDEISLCFLVSGCPLKCPGCHSAESWNPAVGQELTLETLKSLLDKYVSAVTCVCFLGGEWCEAELKTLCAWVQSQGLKTCLYTGLEDVSSELKEHLDYLKVGPYRKELGGLSSARTNQRFYNLKTQQILNHQFTTQGGNSGQAQ